MIVDRWTWQVKPGCTKDALALMKEGAKGVDYPVRLYSDEIGPTFTVVFEAEYESMAEMAGLESETTPEQAASLEKFFALLQGPGRREIWNLVE